MNNQRRQKIKKQIKRLESNGIDEDEEVIADETRVVLKNNFASIQDEIEGILYEEEESYENMPEGIQNSERGETSANCIDMLNDIMESFDDLKGIIDKYDVKDAEDYINLINEKIEEISEMMDDVICS